LKAKVSKTKAEEGQPSGRKSLEQTAKKMCDMFATAKSSVLPGNGGVNVNLVEAM
jgi:hypothetical protein